MRRYVKKYISELTQGWGSWLYVMKPWLSSWLESRALFSVGQLSPPSTVCHHFEDETWHRIAWWWLPTDFLLCITTENAWGSRYLGFIFSGLEWLMDNNLSFLLSWWSISQNLPWTIRRFNTELWWASSLSRLASFTFLPILKLEARLLTQDYSPDNMS